MEDFGERLGSAFSIFRQYEVPFIAEETVKNTSQENLVSPVQ